MNRTTTSPFVGRPAAAARNHPAAAVAVLPPNLLYAAKIFLSIVLAYWIALRIGLERPYWAVTTCLIVAHPWQVRCCRRPCSA